MYGPGAVCSYLVRLVGTIWVSDGCHQVVLFLEHVVSDASHVSKLHICVDIDFHDTEADRCRTVLLV